MATIIDINGEETTIETLNKTRIVISNDSNVKEIIKLSSKILDVVITNNPYLEKFIIGNRALRSLTITNNPLLNTVKSTPITNSVIIKNNPLLDCDKLFLDFSSYPTTHTYYPNIDISNPATKCDNTTNIDDVIFLNNNEGKTKSPKYLNTVNQFIIHNEIYNGKYYPIITIPKGTLLYTYTYVDEHTDILENIYNTNDIDRYDESLKFFYSVPYGAKFGIDGKYNQCNIVVLTTDVRLICLLSPAVQSMETMIHPETSMVIDKTGKQCNYYDDDTHPCEFYEHDLCISKSLRVALNLQGYINIDKDDSMSNGHEWLQTYKNSNYVDIIKEYLQGSCISNTKINNSNYRYINKIFSLKTPNNTLFGLPQIALCPLKNYLFDIPIPNIPDISKKGAIEKYVFEHFNYFMISSCSIDDIENVLETFKKDIVRNRQYHLFYLLNTHKDPSYMHWKNIEPLTHEDIDYLFTYENNSVGCVFETVLFNIKSSDGGGSKKYKKKIGTKTKKQRRSSKMVFKRTSYGMPIMYMK